MLRQYVKVIIDFTDRFALGLLHFDTLIAVRAWYGGGKKVVKTEVESLKLTVFVLTLTKKVTKTKMLA